MEDEAFSHLVFYVDEADESRPRETLVEQNVAEQNIAEQNEAEQNVTEQNESSDELESNPTITIVQAEIHEPPNSRIATRTSEAVKPPCLGGSIEHMDKICAKAKKNASHAGASNSREVEAQPRSADSDIEILEPDNSHHDPDFSIEDEPTDISSDSGDGIQRITSGKKTVQPPKATVPIATTKTSAAAKPIKSGPKKPPALETSAAPSSKKGRAPKRRWPESTTMDSFFSRKAAASSPPVASSSSTAGPSASATSVASSREEAAENPDENSDECYSSSEEASTLSRTTDKRKKYTCKYLKKWEKLEDFKDWLTPSPKGRRYFHCAFCRTDVCLENKGQGDLTRHSKSKKHQGILANRSSTHNVDEFVTVHAPSNIDKSVKEAEVRWGGFTSEHNLPFNISDHASQLFPIMFPDSEIAAKFQCRRTKTTAIVRNVIGAASREELNEMLRVKKFALIIDESTDLGTTKNLSLSVRYFDPKRRDARDRFFDMKEMVKGDAISLYNAIKKSFDENNIPYKSNMVGFAADGTNVMHGRKNSVKALFLIDCPDLFTLSCICHSFAICASRGCEQLPKYLEDLLRDTYSYVRGSALRTGHLHWCQKMCDVKQHKMLKRFDIRWLSLEECVRRFLEQYDALLMFFRNESKDSTLLAARKILDWLTDPQTKIFLQFLSFVLPEILKMNLLFQSERCLILELYDKLLSLYKTFLSFFTKRNLIDQAETLDPTVPSNFLPLEEVYVGPQAQMSLLESKNKDMNQHIRTRCLNFFVATTKAMLEKFNFKDHQLWKDLCILHPKKVLNQVSLAPVLRHYKFLGEDVTNKIDIEFRGLAFELTLKDTDNVSEFYGKVFEINLGNTLKYPNLSYFIQNHVFTLPHSSACVERDFSTQNLNKTKLRNRIENPTMKGIMHSKAFIDTDNCYDFDISDNVLKFFNKNMYDGVS